MWKFRNRFLYISSPLSLTSTLIKICSIIWHFRSLWNIYFFPTLSPNERSVDFLHKLYTRMERLWTDGTWIILQSTRVFSRIKIVRCCFNSLRSIQYSDFFRTVANHHWPITIRITKHWLRSFVIVVDYHVSDIVLVGETSIKRQKYVCAAITRQQNERLDGEARIGGCTRPPTARPGTSDYHCYYYYY